MKRIAVLTLFLVSAAIAVFGQAVRIDVPLQTYGPNVPTSGGPLPQTLWLANGTVNLCTHPSTSLASCKASPVVTYTDSSLSVPCPSTAQLVEIPGSTCTASSGIAGNVGFWYAGGVIDYWITGPYGTYGPFSVGGPISGGGGGGGTGGVEPSKFGAVADAQSSKTGSMTSGANILNCSGCSFTSLDVGKTISVEGASNTSLDQPLVTTIVTVNSPTQVVLAASATATTPANTGVIWGTDNFNSFQSWLNAIPNETATISGGNYLINIALASRILEVSSNTSITMARGSKLYEVGVTLTTPIVPPPFSFPGLFRMGNNVVNVQFKNMNISGEYQNTNVSVVNGNGYGGDCMFTFQLGGAVPRHFQLTDSYISNIYGNVVKNFNPGDTDVQILDNTVVSTGDTPLNVNSAQTTISRNYIDQTAIPTGVGTDAIEASGGSSHYDNNILLSVTGQYAIALGGITSGPPFVGTSANGNLILNPRTPAGGISIGDGFTEGEVSHNLILGVDLGVGILNQQSGSVFTGSNRITNNTIQSNSGNSIGIENSSSGDFFSGNTTSGTFYGLLITGGGSIISTGNASSGSIRDLEISGTSITSRDELMNPTLGNTFHFGIGGGLNPDSYLFSPSLGTIFQPPVPTNFSTPVTAPYFSTATAGTGSSTNNPAGGTGGWTNLMIPGRNAGNACIGFDGVMAGTLNFADSWLCSEYNSDYSNNLAFFVPPQGNVSHPNYASIRALTLGVGPLDAVYGIVHGSLCTGNACPALLAGSGQGDGNLLVEGSIRGQTTAPTTGTGCTVFQTGWVWASDGTYSYCNGTSYTQPLGASSLNGGAVGSLPYQSALNSTSFLASPTTSGHWFVPVWSPGGSPVNPAMQDLGSFVGNNVTATSPIVATPGTLGTVLSCPTCGVAGAGTAVTINGGGALGNLDINATTPAADAAFTAMTPKISGASVIIEGPDATGSTKGLVQPGASMSITSGVITPTNISGGTSGQVGILGSASTITSSIPLGNSGSNIPQLSGGLLNSSVIPNNAANTTGFSAGLAAGSLGYVPYQSAANTTTYVAGPTTSGHQFFLGWSPSGSAIAPASFDLGTYLGTNVTASSPIVATPSTLGTQLSCPTCGTAGGGTSLGVNGGATLGSANLNAISPVADAGFFALTPKESSGNIIIESPQGSASTFGVLKCSTGLACSGGVASTTSFLSGMNAGEVAIAGSSTTTTSSIPLGVTGSDIPQLAGGKLNSAVIPNPSASTLGGIESYVGVSHQWVSSISTSGVPGSTQPAFTDISGNLGTSQGPSSITGILKDTAGTLSAAAAGTDYQGPLVLTTTGTGAATLTSGVNLNIPANVEGSGLTSNHILLGGGGSNIAADSAAITDGAGNGTFTSLTTSGTKNGAITLQSVASAALAETTNQVLITVPNAVTHYTMTLPGSQPSSSSAGFISCTNANPAVCSFVQPSNWSGTLSGDVSGGQTTTSVNKINGTSLSLLATGILKNTTTTGVPSIAVSSDVTATFSGTCNSGTFLRGDGACAAPTGSGTVNTGTATQFSYYATTGTAVSPDTLLTESGTVLGYTGTGGITAPVITSTGAANGNLNLTSTASTPSSPATSTIQLTVPNAVTAYRRTFAGGVPSVPSVGVYSTIGVESWTPVSGAGAGLVSGPTSATTTNNVVAYADTVGTVKDSGVSINSIPAKSQRAVYTNATATPSTIWSFPIAASQSLAIDCKGAYKAATSGNFTLTVTGPASPTTVTYNHHVGQSITTRVVTYNDYTATGSAYPSGINTTAVGTAATDMPFEIVLQIINGANAGTIAIQGATLSTNTLTIEAGAYCVAL